MSHLPRADCPFIGISLHPVALLTVDCAGLRQADWSRTGAGAKRPHTTPDNAHACLQRTDQHPGLVRLAGLDTHSPQVSVCAD
eukprot:superscaffoldBa00000551_g5578